MKKNIFFIAAIMLISAVTFWACNKDDEGMNNTNSTPNEQEESSPNEQQEVPVVVCEFENPLTDLPWLKKMIAEIESDEREPGHFSWFGDRVEIYQCAYKGGIGFLINPCVEGCYDTGLWLMNCEGERLCILWGFAGDPCAEFEIDHESKILIWERYKD